MKKIRVGAVGLGRLGYKHAENLAMRIPGVHLEAVCSIQAQEILHAKETLGVMHGYTEYTALLQHDGLDAVILTTPSEYHCEQIELALEAGLDVFCEKPLGTTVEACKKAETAVEKHPDAICMLGFMRRFDPSYQDAKAQIDQGVIGRPVLFRGYSVDPESAIEGALAYAPHSAGQFLDMAVHDIDLARWMLGSEPKTIMAMGGCYAHEAFSQYGDGDNVAALMQCENEAMAFFLAGRTAPHGYNVETEIIGTKATLRIGSVPQRNLVEILDQSGVRKVCSQDFLERFGAAFLHELTEFVACVRERRKPEITVYDGTRATEIAVLATQSFQENKLIHL